MTSENQELQKIVDLSSWEEFGPYISNLRNAINYFRKDTDSRIYPILFRGHSDSGWKLQSSLRRKSKQSDENWKMSFDEYHNYLLQPAYNAVVSSFGSKYIPELDDDPKYLNYPPYITDQYSNYLGFMVYAKHHYFPSPLLDWTRSPYVAAYFAFKDAHISKTGRVAIFVFVESMGDGKSNWTGCPHIASIGPNIKSHERHYAQQCEYTICAFQDGSKDKFYASHTVAFSIDSGVIRLNDCQQDLLFKVTIPISERDKALDCLNEMNVNEYSLFKTEDALMFKLKEDFRDRFLAWFCHDKCCKS